MVHPSRPSVSEAVSERCELKARRRRTMLCIGGRTLRPGRLPSSFETRALKRPNRISKFACALLRMKGALKNRYRGPELGEPALERFHRRQLRGFLLIFGQPEADDVDPAAGNRARDQHYAIERQRRALLRRMVEMDVEIIGKGQLHSRLVHLDAVNLGQFT